ncbi:MAG: NAD(+)/NADH kinase [Planctomycetota bacterium]|nr:NAD(+)/NADH kinase [Planctomycetota bacterium]
MKILYDEENTKAASLHGFLAGRLNIEGDDQVNIVLGGDGFMLRSVREHYSPDAVFLGINCGSVGFLLNNLPQDLEELVRRLQSKSYSVQSFPRIRTHAEGLDGQTWEAAAINDIYLERMVPQANHLRIVINEITVVEKMVCDGMVFATALGSTAYNFSAAGPACHPSLKVLCATPICPHTPRLHPAVLPLDSTIQLEVLDPLKRRAQAVADGVVFPNVLRLTITLDPREVKLAYFEDHDYTAQMIEKVLAV